MVVSDFLVEWMWSANTLIHSAVYPYAVAFLMHLWKWGCKVRGRARGTFGPTLWNRASVQLLPRPLPLLVLCGGIFGHNFYFSLRCLCGWLQRHIVLCGSLGKTEAPSPPDPQRRPLSAFSSARSICLFISKSQSQLLTRCFSVVATDLAFLLSSAPTSHIFPFLPPTLAIQLIFVAPITKQRTSWDSVRQLLSFPAPWGQTSVCFVSCRFCVQNTPCLCTFPTSSVSRHTQEAVILISWKSSPCRSSDMVWKIVDWLPSWPLSRHPRDSSCSSLGF